MKTANKTTVSATVRAAGSADMVLKTRRTLTAFPFVMPDGIVEHVRAASYEEACMLAGAFYADYRNR